MSEQSSQPRLSLIIPIYNGRAYIPSLMNTITNQHFTGLEVILIDDGSTDGSADAIESVICGEMESDQISWRLIREENQGQGAARNTGLQAASGRWIAFMDQDDRLCDPYLETMYEIAEGSPCDILISGYDSVLPDGTVIEHVSLQETSWSRFMNVTPWGKLYRLDYMREHGLRFYPTPLGEDVYLTLMAESCHPNIRITSYVGYCWVNNKASVSHTVHRRLDAEASILTLLQTVRDQISALDYEDPELQYFLLKTAIYHLLLVAGNTERRELLAYNKELFEYLESLAPGIMRNPLIRLNRPIGERRMIRYVVWIYAIFHRLHVDPIILLTYGRISSR